MQSMIFKKTFAALPNKIKLKFELKAKELYERKKKGIYNLTKSLQKMEINDLSEII